MTYDFVPVCAADEVAVEALSSAEAAEASVENAGVAEALEDTVGDALD